jgi:hypothetical protein
MYDFKKKVLGAMKARHDRVTGRGTHAGYNEDQDEDLSAVDSLAEKLYKEMMEVVDRNEASPREAELMKSLKKSASNILVPLPPPDLPSLGTQQSTAVRNPLSVLTGNIPNNVPNLDEELALAITPRMAKRQRLTNNDCGDAIGKFVEKSGDLFATFSTFVENKAKADNRSLLLQLLDKLEKGIITQHQFEAMKPIDL